VFLENVTAQRVKEQVVAVATPRPAPQPVPENPVVVIPVPEPVPEAPVIPVVPNFMPAAPVAATALTERNLVWGRFGGGQGENERITTDYATAVAGRDVTVGDPRREYALFRDGGGRMRVDSGLGLISFQLHSAQAYYSSADGIFTMAVNGGELEINFTNNQFATSLDLNHSLTGNVNFAASGIIREGGFFYVNSPAQTIRGAVSLDGREAGYFFEKQLEIGGIHGLTLWDRR